MSQENVNTLREVYDEWGKGNFQAGGDLWDRLALFIPLVEIPEEGYYVGPEGPGKFMRRWLGA